MYKCTLTITATEIDRLQEFKTVFGTDTVPILSPIPCQVVVDCEPQNAYMLDVDKLEDHQLDALIKHIAYKFETTEEEAAHGLAKHGLPILSRGTRVVVHDPARWLN